MSAGDGRRPVAVAAGLLALAALVASRLGPGPARAAAAAPLLLGGATLPVLLRWSPVEPSAIKLGLLAALLSPPLLALLRFGLGSAELALFVVALLQLLALGRRVRFERPGVAGLASLALALVLGAGTAWLLLGGWAPRLDRDAQVWNTAVAEALLRDVPLENPFLAGEPLPTHPGYAALVAATAELLDTATATAAALLTVWAVALVTVALFLTAAPAWGRVAPVVAAPVAVLLLWSAPAWIVGEDVLAPALRDPLSTVGAAAPALALAAGTWLAAAHGLRHGRRPWVGLIGVLGGACFLVAPVPGLVALGVPLVVALVAPGVPAVRASVPLAVLAGALPGLWLARRFGLDSTPAPPGASDPASALLLLLPLALAALLAIGPVAARGRERRALLGLAAAGGVLPAAAALLLPGHALVLSRLASVGLAPLAAAGLTAGPAARRVAAAALVVLAGVEAARLALARAERARGPLAVAARDGGVEPAFVPETELAGDGLVPTDVLVPRRTRERAAAIRRRHRALAYRWIRARRGEWGEDTVLVRSLGGSGDRGRGELGLHLAPLYAGLSLWCDDAPGSGGRSPRWTARREHLRRLFERPTGFDPHALRELEVLGRGAVILVEEVDREATSRGPYQPLRGVDRTLERLGATRVHVVGTAAVYRWIPREGA